MMNPFQKLGKRISKAVGGGGRRQSVGLDESNGLQNEDSHNGDASPSNPTATPPLKTGDDKGIVQTFSSGMESFIKAITDTGSPRPMPLRTSVPEEDQERNHDDEKEEPEEHTVVLDANTPVEVLLSRIEFLETNMRSESRRAEALEQQVNELADRCAELERVAHRSILARIFRPFRICCGACM